MAKIVITDIDFDSTAPEEERAAAAGVELAVFQDRSAEAIIKNAADADGIMLSYGDCNASVFEALEGKLKVVSRSGIGYDNIDLEAATKHGVAVCVVPGYATEVVSDHAITLALCALRRIPECVTAMAIGQWGFAPHRPLGQCFGRTFGIVGMGEIGRATARKAAGMGFRVICWSRSLVPGRRTPEGYEIMELDQLVQEADIISTHCALCPDTHHLINAERIAMMKPSAVVVNTARGPVIDTDALAAALCEGRIWGAGLDVFEGEPVDFNSAICHAPHTVLTPHSAYWSEESGEELRRRTLQNAIDVVQGKIPTDCLNPQVLR